MEGKRKKKDAEEEGHKKVSKHEKMKWKEGRRRQGSR